LWSIVAPATLHFFFRGLALGAIAETHTKMREHI